MAENKHTATPWTFHTDSSDGKVRSGDLYWLNGNGGETILESLHNNLGIIKEEEAQANAERIVRCVNHFDELVKALESLRLLENENNEGWVNDALTIVHKALKNAQR